MVKKKRKIDSKLVKEYVVKIIVAGLGTSLSSGDSPVARVGQRFRHRRGVAQTAAFRFERIDLGVKRPASPGTSRSPCTSAYLWHPNSVRTGPLSSSRTTRENRVTPVGRRRRNESPTTAQARTRNSHTCAMADGLFFSSALKSRNIPAEKKRIIKRASEAAKTEISFV